MNINTTEQLKPCPFCSGKPDLIASHIYYDKIYYVECTQCGCKTTYTFVNHPSIVNGRINKNTIYTDIQAQDKAIQSWNKRSANTFENKGGAIYA